MVRVPFCLDYLRLQVGLVLCLISAGYHVHKVVFTDKRQSAFTRMGSFPGILGFLAS